MQVAQEISEYELERGEPLPSKNHGIVQLNVSLAFGRYAKKYSFIPELSLELDGESLVPDISVFPKLEVDRQRRTRSSLIAESLPDSPIPVDVAFSE
ncbi:MAG: hypothetical protein GY856_14365 [bacterium]|nr:hypothetical protein [bacterium]